MSKVKFTCPECQHELELKYSYCEEDCIFELYHCENCGSAWKIEKKENSFEKLERYFFG